MNTPALVYPLNHYRLEISIVSRHQAASDTMTDDDMEIFLSELEETDQICEQYFPSSDHHIHSDVDNGVMTRIIDETLSPDYVTRVNALKRELKNARWNATILIQLGAVGHDKILKERGQTFEPNDDFDEFVKHSTMVHEYIEKHHTFTV